MEKYTPSHAAPKKRRPRKAKPTPERAKRPAPKPAAPDRPKKPRRRRHGRSAALAVLLAAAAVTVLLLRGDELKGVWALDDTTVYEFDGRGHGTLRLPLGSYDFVYTVEGDRLTIDFADETAADAGYAYARDGAYLTLDADAGVDYRLEKRE